MKTFTNPAICSRITEAATVLNPYFGTDSEDIICESLNQVGVIDETELSLNILQYEITDEDFSAALIHNSRAQAKKIVVAPARMRVAWLILKGIDPFKQTEPQISNVTNLTTSSDATTLNLLLSAVQQNRPIGQLSDLELIAKYSKDCSSEVECELLKRSRGRPCIIFKNDDTVDTDNSLILLRKARHQETPSTYAIDSGIKSVYKVGDFPMNVLYECPIHSHILLVDGYCEECGLKWLDFEANREKYIFLRIISESAKIDPVNLRTYLQQQFEQLTSLHPKLFLKYTELKEEDKLPTLKRRLSKAKNGDPFRVIHTQY